MKVGWRLHSAGRPRAVAPTDAEPACFSRNLPRRSGPATSAPHPPRATVTPGTATTRPGCGGALHLLGKDVTEVLDYVPASFRVLRHVRPKFCGRASAAPAAHVLVAEYFDHDHPWLHLAELGACCTLTATAASRRNAQIRPETPPDGCIGTARNATTREFKLGASLQDRMP